jgi:hypothetical protein
MMALAEVMAGLLHRSATADTTLVNIPRPDEGVENVLSFFE